VPNRYIATLAGPLPATATKRQFQSDPDNLRNLLEARGVIHREGTTAEEPGEIALVRVGSGLPVVNLDGPDPEWPSAPCVNAGRHQRRPRR